MKKDRVTSETIFLYGVLNNDDACAEYELNIIAIGRDALTLETLIHELNEIQISQILQDLGYENKTITYKQYVRIPRHVSHLLSPYGYKSLIYPYNKNKKEMKLNE